MSVKNFKRGLFFLPLAMVLTACGGGSSGGQSADADSDGDGVADSADAFPNDSSEQRDFDRDGIGDNADTDDDNDNVADSDDAFPNDASESADFDRDGTGDNADTDDDGDGVADTDDKFPKDVTESADADDDGIGDNADDDDDNDGTVDTEDEFPNDEDRTTSAVADSFEPDDEAATASVISAGGTSQKHTHFKADNTVDVDFVSFSVSAGTQYLLSTCEHGDSSSVGMEILNSDQDVSYGFNEGGCPDDVRSCADTGSVGRDACVVVQATEDTTLIAAVYFTGLDTGASANGSGTQYELTLETGSFADGSADAFEEDDNVDDANSIAIDEPQQHNFVDDIEDHLMLAVVAGQRYTVTTQNVGRYADTVINVRDSLGNRLAANDDCEDCSNEVDSQVSFTADENEVVTIVVHQYAEVGFELGPNVFTNYTVIVNEGGPPINNPDAPQRLTAENYLAVARTNLRQAFDAGRDSISGLADFFNEDYSDADGTVENCENGGSETLTFTDADASGNDSVTSGDSYSEILDSCDSGTEVENGSLEIEAPQVAEFDGTTFRTSIEINQSYESISNNGAREERLRDIAIRYSESQDNSGSTLIMVEYLGGESFAFQQSAEESPVSTAFSLIHGVFRVCESGGCGPSNLPRGTYLESVDFDASFDTFFFVGTADYTNGSSLGFIGNRNDQNCRHPMPGSNEATSAVTGADGTASTIAYTPANGCTVRIDADFDNDGNVDASQTLMWSEVIGIN